MILRIAILAGATAGICSLFYFLSVAVGAGPYVPLVASIACSAALCVWFRLPAPVESPKPHPLLLATFFVVLAASIAAFVFIASKQPHGFLEAYSTWNLHARFLERDGGAHWTSMFSKAINWTHPDDPLLLSALIAQLWAVLHSETVAVPMGVAFFYTFGSAALLVGAVRHFRGWNQALIAGTFLLGSAELIEQGVVQYADLPLAFYMIAGLALLCLDDPKSSILGGVMAGLAAWTKHEGLLFVVALAGGLLYARRKMDSRFAIGLAPVLAVVALFQFRYAPWIAKVAAIDFGRVVTVIEGFVVSAFELGSFLVPAVLLLAAYGWLVGVKPRPEHRKTVVTIAATVIFMFAGDMLLYVLFGNDPGHPEAAYIQLFPSALLGFFLATADIRFERQSAKPRKAAATRQR